MARSLGSSQMWGEIPASTESETVVFHNAKPTLDQIQNSAFAEEVSKPLYEMKMPQPKANNIDPKFCAMEENVVYTIALLKYTNYLEDLIEKYKAGTSNMTEVKHILSQPPVPKFDEKSLPKARKQINKLDEKNGISYFRQGKWAPEERPPQIPSKKILLKLLTKSVITILAHAGFDDTMGSAASVLTEVADDYFNKFLSTLRDNSDDFVTPSTSVGFADPMEATYQQMGIGSILVISDFYQTMVVGQRIKVKNKIIELYEELKDLYNTSKKLNTYSNIVRIGNINSTGPGDVLQDVTDEYLEDFPELHLSSQKGENFDAVLAPGLSLLETLESAERGENK